MRRALAPVDLVITAYFGLVTALMLAGWRQLSNPWPFLGLNAAVVGGAWLFARLGGTRGGVWSVLHDWFPVVAVLAAFGELKAVIPDLHPFVDRRFDFILARLDDRWFGDVRGFFRAVTFPALTDLLSVCYWSYYPLPLVLGGALWKAKEAARFRETAAVLLVAWYLSYLGYFAVPAVGPHHVVDGPRDAALDGWLAGGFLHRSLMAIEGEVADAFPSGHALIAMVALHLAWRHHRRLFWWFLPFGSGLALSTLYLRYHYAVDVAASVALAPVSVALGRRLTSKWSVESGASRV